jgi:hypothetical protein
MLGGGVNLDSMSELSAGAARPVPLAAEAGEDHRPARDLPGYLARYPREIALGGGDPGEIFDRYHTPDFVLYNDGFAMDRERLLAHVRPARRNAVDITTTVHRHVRYDDRVAARYTLTATLRHGQVVATAIAMVGQVAPDGRLCRVDQVTEELPTPSS